MLGAVLSAFGRAGRVLGGAVLGGEWLASVAQCVTLDAYGGPSLILAGLVIAFCAGLGPLPPGGS